MYCFMGAASNSVLQSLEVLFNSILRTVTFDNFRCFISPLYKPLRFPKFRDLYRLEVAKMIHRFTFVT